MTASDLASALILQGIRDNRSDLIDRGFAILADLLTARI